MFSEFLPGRQMCWRRFGEGTPIVLLHGGHGSWLHWIRNVEALSRSFTVWIADMPGFGDSDSPTAGLGVPDMAAIIDSSISSLIGAETALDLVGFSFGGLMATQIAVSRPNVRRLATVGLAGHGGVRRQSKPMVQWRGLPPEEETAALRQNLEALMLSPKNADDELALQIHRTCCYRTRFRSSHLSRQAPLPALLAKLFIPIHFIWGSDDVTAFPETLRSDLVGARKERRLTIIPGVGHWTQFEAAKEVDEILIRWLRDS